MKKGLTTLLLFLFLSQVHTAVAQELIKSSSRTLVCYGSNKVNKSYIPPPDAFFRKSGSKNGGTITIYYTGFSAQGKAAMEYAKSILEKLLPADAKFTVVATWEKISTSGVLAQSSITGYAGGWAINALNPISIYPVALAEKIAGVSLNNDTDGDITLSVNSSINWYLGTDGVVPAQKYDLITVALHELCHGLGFFDSFSVTGTIGSWGIASIPMIYDTFVENFSGNRLTDTLKFLNNSNDLKVQLLSNQVYFNGPLLTAYSKSAGYGLLRAKLYAPNPWDAGSSISHLNEIATLPENALMTPFVDLQEAIHDPGKFTFSILGDLGWINTRIIHTPMGDTESHLNQIALSTVIKSDTSYNHNKVGVVYSYNNFLTSDSLFMTSPGSNNNYNITIPVPSYNSQLQYYFFVYDAFLRTYRSPSVYKDYPGLKNNRYHIFIGTDTVKPVIIHTPAPYYLQTVDSVKFNALASDNLGIDSVYVEYKVNNGPSKFIRLKNVSTNSYRAVFSAKSLSLKGHDSIQYKIFAVDTAAIPNIAVLPGSGFFATHIEEISSTLPGYITDFSNAGPDFFNVGFTVSKPTGFSKFGLNSKHPYESPEDNNKTIAYTAMLRHPLKFSESGMFFSFNELVLVEPGDAGSVFGSSSFYDYVVIDASVDFGKSWFNIIDGYDSRLFPSWETAYNSSISGNNSTYTGTESMLQKHTFLYRPSDKISSGDTILVRFRLFSDPFANGWGWVIEDLKIGPLIDAVKEVNSNLVRLYPNPGRGLIKITSGPQGQDLSKPLRYSIFNSAGICLLNGTSPESPETLVNISEYPAGMYIIILYLDDGIRSIKYSLIK
jgi:hypothetical protein